MRTYAAAALCFLWVVLSSSAAMAADSGRGPLTEDDMDGEIVSTPTGRTFISWKDYVVLDLDPDTVMTGDRLDIYSEMAKNNRGFSGLFEFNSAVEPIGTLVVVTTHRGEVYGLISSVKREITIGDYVKFPLPDFIQHSRYFDFLKNLVKAKLKQPTDQTLKVALMDAVNKRGDVTRLSNEVYKELRDATCLRPQFDCVDNREIAPYLKKWGVSTSADVGKILKKELQKELGLDMFLTATVDAAAATVYIGLESWDMVNGLKTPTVRVESNKKNYPLTRGNPDDILLAGTGQSYGFLRITVDYDSYVKERRVADLYVDDLDTYLFSRYKKELSERLSDDVGLSKATLSMGGKIYRPDETGLLFEGLVPAKDHRMVLTVVPVLRGQAPLVIGNPIEKQFVVSIPSDTAIKAELLLKTYGNNAIMVMDSNPMDW